MTTSTELLRFLLQMFPDVVVAVTAPILAMWWPKCTAVRRLREIFLALSAKPVVSFLAVFALAVGLRLALVPTIPIPAPAFHDEFSYLLAADTFSNGRLTNPQPLIPEAFETIHVNLWPTYQSMYMPGTGLALAVGQRLGSPWLAVLALGGLLCAFVYWSIAGWLPRHIALLVALIAIINQSNWNRWFDNYFCVALPALGGALALGSVPRVLSRSRLTDTLAFGLGCSALLLTRPVEGGGLVLPLVAIFGKKLLREGPSTLAKRAGPAIAVVSVAAGFLLVYNYRGTGSPFLSPYAVNYHQYHFTSPFVLMPPTTVPRYRNESLQKFYVDWEQGTYDLQTTHPALFLLLKVAVYHQTFAVGLGLLLGLGVFSLARDRTGIRAAGIGAVGCTLLVLAAGAWYPFPQYASPVYPGLLLVAGYGLRSLATSKKWNVNGSQLALGYMASYFAVAVILFFTHLTSPVVDPSLWFSAVERPRIERLLSNHPGKHICLVHYSAAHRAQEEWIFNRADISKARILWVRSIGYDADRKTIEAYPDRQPWVLDPDQASSAPRRYHPAAYPGQAPVGEWGKEAVAPEP